MHAGAQMNWYASVQVYSSTCMQVCIYVQLCRRTGVLECIFTAVQGYRCTLGCVKDIKGMVLKIMLCQYFMSIFFFEITKKGCACMVQT